MVTGSLRPTLAAIACLACAVPAQQGEVFHRPVRLRAAGAWIDTGNAWGHSGPCVEDVDGDGARDLVVGDFSGKFRFFRNEGTDEKPRFAKQSFLQAAGKDATVPIY